MATQEQINKVRLYCYSPSEELISDETIGAYIDKWLAIYPKPEQEPIALYNATIDCLYYLIYTDPDYQSGASGSSRMEKVGQVQVEVTSTGEYVSRWARILAGYLDGLISIPGLPKNPAKGVIVGGVSRNEINRVNGNRDSVNGLGRHPTFGVDRKAARRPNHYRPGFWSLD